jgi:hypothetical protein
VSDVTVGDVRAFLARSGIPHLPATHYVIVATWPGNSAIQGCCDDVAESAAMLSGALRALGQEQVVTGASPYVVVNRHDLRAALSGDLPADARDRLSAAAGDT